MAPPLPANSINNCSKTSKRKEKTRQQPNSPAFGSSRVRSFVLGSVFASPIDHDLKGPPLGPSSPRLLSFFFYSRSVSDTHGAPLVFSHLWLSLPFCEPMWISVDLCEPMWIYVDLCGPQWSSLDLCGTLWTTADFC